MNEAFVPNMTGKNVKYDIQPYERGEGLIEAIQARKVTVSDFDGLRGRVIVTYEVFDLFIRVRNGSRTGALMGGVPVPGTTRSMNGQLREVIGASYHQIHRAVEHGETIVIARCG